MKFALKVTVLLSLLNGGSMLALQPQVTKKLVIGCNQPYAGFFALFFTALNNIAWCDKNNILPVVYWGTDCLYHEKTDNETINAWEYYFEPVSSASYEQSDPIRNHFRDPHGGGINLIFDNCVSYNTEPELKRTVHAIIKKYIKIKPHILEKIDLFYNNHMQNRKTIGIHMRGTDKKNEIAVVSIEEIADAANKAAEKISADQFLVATDEQKLLEQIKPLLHRPVIYCQVNRSHNGRPIHKISQKKKLMGEEVLIETQLLAKCDIFVHTCSNVSSAVLFFNPELKNILLKKDQSG